jgi:curved DNA-binding protein CbpA
MELHQEGSLYDILDIKPDASPQEVREAYLRTKAAYGKDSVALYTLISTSEREEMLGRIEEAYDVLSSADRRKDYDRQHGLLDFDEEANTPSRVPLNQKIISIDRVPPMEATRDSESLLVAPTTDFTAGSGSIMPLPPAGGTLGLHSNPFETPSTSGIAKAEFTEIPVADPGIPAAPERPRSSSRAAESALTQEILQEIEWKGNFFRKVREARRVSLEEMANITKVSKTYILAIEDENFAKLPAPVFLRGFVTQIAKVLKLPHDPAAAAYMARYFQTRPDSKPAK